MLAAPCSFGKTTVASQMIQNAMEKGKRCAFIVDRVELIDQASERFYSDDIDHGIIQGDHPMTDYSKLCQVATIQTLRNRRLQDFDFCIIDEAHVLHKTHIKYMEAFDNVPFIGLSASPYTKGLGKHFQDLVVPITTGQLMQEGYLCEYECYAPSEPDLKGVKVSRGDYDEKQLEERVNKAKIVGDIVREHQSKAKGRPTVVFAVSIAHSKHICEEFKKVGLRSAHVDCHTDKDTRKMINDQFKSGLIDVLSCVAIFEKGWDAPLASCLIMAAPTKSIMRYVQQVGRILRTCEGKDKSIILDHAGNTLRHGWVEEIIPDHLDDGEKKENTSAKKEKKKKEPSKCPKCGYIKEDFVCAACGFKPNFIQNVEVEAGTLEKKSKKSKATVKEKEVFYSHMLFYARSKGLKDGWAYFKVREKFGAPLKKTRHIKPEKPSEDSLRYIKYVNIKRAKARKAEVC